MNFLPLLSVAGDLELAGLRWIPEIGDEVSERERPRMISVLVDPKGMAYETLRSTYLWLPTLEQMVSQLEARQAILFHAGLELTQSALCYKTVIQSTNRQIECRGESLRVALGLALRDLLLADVPSVIN